MLTLTEKAVHYITKLFEKENMRPPPGGIRFGIKAGKCSGFQYFYELIKNEVPGDRIMMLWGVRVIVDAKSLELMRGTEIDCSDNLLDPPFVFRNNPKVKSTCGCGVSFELKA